MMAEVYKTHCTGLPTQYSERSACLLRDSQLTKHLLAGLSQVAVLAGGGTAAVQT